jgi:phosphodiesterase/alkaline phosphatase D-like protein
VGQTKTAPANDADVESLVLFSVEILTLAATLAYRRAPMLGTWDDHETTDNAYGMGAEENVSRSMV